MQVETLSSQLEHATSTCETAQQQLLDVRADAESAVEGLRWVHTTTEELNERESAKLRDELSQAEQELHQTEQKLQTEQQMRQAQQELLEANGKPKEMVEVAELQVCIVASCLLSGTSHLILF